MATGQADIIDWVEAADLAIPYEMDVTPDGRDLDSNSTNDFFSGTSRGLKSAHTVSGALPASHQSAANPEIPFQTDFNGCLTEICFRVLVLHRRLKRGCEKTARQLRKQTAGFLLLCSFQLTKENRRSKF